MDAIVSILYWIKLALLVAIVVLTLWSAARGSGNRVLVPWRAGMQAILAVAAFAVVTVVGGAAFSVLWALALLVLGCAAGYFVARRERCWRAGGRACVRRTPLVPWVWAVSVILVAMTLLFGSSHLFALAALVMALALGMVLGQVTAELLGASRAESSVPSQPVAAPGGVA